MANIANTINVDIVLDAREVMVKAQLDLLNAQYKTEQLVIGDIIFKKDDNTLLICERKTAEDLYSSIISGRYREQRARLKASGCKICYIIENLRNVNDKHLVLITGALENLVIEHNIYILPTLSVAHTAKCIVNIKNKYTKLQLEKPICDVSNAEPSIVAIFTQKKTKMLEHIHEHQLILIPGVSTKSAKVIAEIYPTAKSLVDMYNSIKDTKGKMNLLADLSLGNRKLGKVLSERIYSVYCGSEDAVL